MERTIHKYIQLDKQPRYYGHNVALSQAEIHTLSVINSIPDINITKLATIRGITKGSASQMIYKLVNKGLVEKNIAANSTKVSLTLTETGKKALDDSKKDLQNSKLTFFKTFEEMPDDCEKYLTKLLTDLDEMLDERLNNK